MLVLQVGRKKPLLDSRWEIVSALVFQTKASPGFQAGVFLCSCFTGGKTKVSPGFQVGVFLWPCFPGGKKKASPGIQVGDVSGLVFQGEDKSFS